LEKKEDPGKIAEVTIIEKSASEEKNVE